MNRDKLLIVEDDENLGQILKEYLELKGFATHLARDGEEGLSEFNKQDFNLCILDIMMPKKDGFTLAREIKLLDRQVPIIFLTAKSMKEDTIEGFKIGADDYVTKPFSMEELLLRITAVLRRSGGMKLEKKTSYEFGKFIFHYDQQLLEFDKQKQKLTSKESELLRLLCQNMNQTLDRSAALKMIWKDDSYFNARSMDVYIAKLRKHLKKDQNIQILTIHGEGFKLVSLT
ncbi:MAG: transcriptional regulatory protein RprY [Cyclobacteriaceae bacterium]|nr:MAG: transcriptional regulatory protein RprY [Cyclobacteriaceae bacterium]